MSGGGQTSTSTTASGPPAYLQPYVTYGAQQAQSLYDSGGPQYYPGSAVAAQSPATQAAAQGIAALASNGSPVNSAASGYLTNLLNGSYLSLGNPYQGAVDKAISDSVLPGVEGRFSAAGRYGSGAMAGAMTGALADAIAPQEYQTYNSMLGLMNQGAGLAPSAAAAPYYGLNQLAGVGQAQDSHDQNLVNAAMQQWNYNQQLPFDNLSKYMAYLNGTNYGGTSTTTQSQPGGALGGFGGFLGGVLGGLL